MARVDRVHLIVESMRRAYRDRSIYLGDPDFFKVPVRLLTSPDYAAGLRAGISPTHATRSEEHTSELQSLMRISYAVFCLKKKKEKPNTHHTKSTHLLQQLHTVTHTL